MSDLKERLERAGKKAEEQKAEKQARAVKGAHLKEQIEALVTNSGLEVVKNTGFIKVLGNGNKNKLLVAVKGGRVDLSGFTVESPAVIPVSEEEARSKHLGKVRGFVDFDASDDEILAVIKQAIVILQISDPEVERSRTERRARKSQNQTEKRVEA